MNFRKKQKKLLIRLSKVCGYFSHCKIIITFTLIKTLLLCIIIMLSPSLLPFSSAVTINTGDLNMPLQSLNLDDIKSCNHLHD